MPHYIILSRYIAGTPLYISPDLDFGSSTYAWARVNRVARLQLRLLGHPLKMSTVYRSIAKKRGMLSAHNGENRIRLSFRPSPIRRMCKVPLVDPINILHGSALDQAGDHSTKKSKP